MRISLYSCADCWLIVAADSEPTEASAERGPLRFEGTVPARLIPETIRAPLLAQCDADGYVEVSEDLGLALLDQTLSLYGTLTVPPPPAP